MDPGTTEHPDARSDLPLGHIEEWEALAIDYLDGSAPEARARAIETHVQGCPRCKAQLDSQRRVSRLLNNLEHISPPAYLEASVLEQIAPRAGSARPTAAPSTGPLRRLLGGMIRRPWLPATIALVLVAVSLAGATDLLRSSRTTENAAPFSASQPASVEDGSSTLTPEKSAAGESGGAATTAAAAETTAGSSPDTTVSALSVGPGQADTATIAAPDQTLTTAATMAGPNREASVAVLWAIYGADSNDLVVAGNLVEGALGLRPLPASLALGGATFAARVARGDVQTELDLVRATGVDVTLSDAPPSSNLDAVARITEADIASYALVTGTPQGDVSPSTDSPAPPDSADEQVLLVLAPYVR